ncbi:hypothetical protein HDU76_005370 [Blyttiomyces sp. JEL0837]|nr:hypothetical protein HDU76_005370 [Blyttiomyces sp. JEL0837]
MERNAKPSERSTNLEPDRGELAAVTTTNLQTELSVAKEETEENQQKLVEMGVERDSFEARVKSVLAEKQAMELLNAEYVTEIQRLQSELSGAKQVVSETEGKLNKAGDECDGLRVLVKSVTSENEKISLDNPITRLLLCNLKRQNRVLEDIIKANDMLVEKTKKQLLEKERNKMFWWYQR